MSANTIKINRKQALMVAHRGLSGIETENTCLSFTAAGQRSYFGIETDVHVTADGKFIIIHDDWTGRVSDANYHVEETAFDELRGIKLKDREDGVCRNDIILPTLDDYVKICKRYGKIGVLELKNHMEENQIAGIIDVIKSRDYIDDIIFISFDLANCLTVRKLIPGVRVQHLTCQAPDDGLIKLFADNGIDIDIHYGVLFDNGGLLEKFHANGMKVNCWTVDSAEDADRLIAMGVDFITSNILE